MILGVLGFLVLYWYDLAAIRGIEWLKLGISLIGSLLVLAGIVSACVRGPFLALSPAVRIPAGLLGILFLYMLVHSLFLEIPFRETYTGPGIGTHLVTTGTYALTRHPGVIWFTLLLCCLFLATASRRLLWAAPVWGAMNVLYVVIQERFFFTRMFGERYRRYQREVPMLLPTWKSVRRCASTLSFGYSRPSGASDREGQNIGTPPIGECNHGKCHPDAETGKTR